jgi:hypothetical protein
MALLDEHKKTCVKPHNSEMVANDYCLSTFSAPNYLNSLLKFSHMTLNHPVYSNPSPSTDFKHPQFSICIQFYHIWYLILCICGS